MGTCKFCFSATLLLISFTNAAVVPSPWENLARTATITATATCGQPEGEIFCHVKEKVSGRFSESCSQCDPAPQEEKPWLKTRYYPAQNAIDDSDSTRWQSPTLAQGLKYHEINLELDLAGNTSVRSVRVLMASSMPRVWAIDRSDDNGQSWKPWIYFAPTTSECQEYFGTSQQEIIADNTVICSTSFSSVEPREGGEILVSLLEGRPSAKNTFSFPQTLQQWTRATHVGIRLLRMHTTPGRSGILQGVPSDLKTPYLNDTTGAIRSYYAIGDISVMGLRL